MTSYRIRAIAVAACAVVAVSGSGTGALAGESTGNGGRTPIGKYLVPASLCAFSGLNDVPDGSDEPDDIFAPGRVQSFGDIIQQVAKFYPGSVADSGADVQAFKPGVTCNKTKGEH